MNKVILLGIDGGTFDLIKPWVERGELPAFKKMLLEGTCGNLKTTVPCLSIPAIPSLFTGTNPGKLGRFGFVKTDGSSITYNDVKENFVWDILADSGTKSCVVDVTGTYPPMIRDGVMISGSAPSERSEYTYPEELKSKVSGFYSEFDLIKKRESDPRKSMSKIIDLAIISERRKWNTFKELMKNGDFGLGVFWVILSDDCQHYYWGLEDTLLKFFKEIDRILKDLIETFENHSIFVVSDHGFESKMKYYFQINSWLREKGYLVMKGTKLKMLLIYGISGILQQLWRSFPKKTRRFLLSFTRSRGTQSKESTSKNFLLLGVDWDNTTMYADSSLGIRINAENKELYEKTRSKIIEELKNLKDDSGNPIIRDAWKREEIFWGKHSQETPDIILLAAKDYAMNIFLSRKVITDVESKKKKRFRGDHLNAREGIFVAYGPLINRNCEIKDLSILDVAPTILHTMGCKISEEMDGRVIREIFTEESGLRDKDIGVQKLGRKVERGRKLASEELDQMQERLKALGYLG